MSLQVRPIDPTEFDQVAQLTLDAYNAAGTIEGSYRERLADPGQRVADGATVLVAAVDGHVLGSVTYVGAENPHFENAGAGDCGFRMLAVDPSSQGGGIGRGLVEACLNLGRDQHRKRVAIYSMEWMPAAHHLYYRLGFVRRPDRDVLFPAGIGYALQYDLVDDAEAHFDPPGPVLDAPPWYEDAWAPPTDSC